MNEDQQPTAAEQLYLKRVADQPRPGEDLRLYVDLDVCAGGQCKDCELQCSYFYHPANNGIRTVVELATYCLVCRRCEEPHCVNACPYEALEQQKERGKLLVRHTMRCVSCRSCSHACPYGTIYPDHVPLAVHNCDFCLDRRDRPEEPLCIKTCPHGALALRTREALDEENTFPVGDHIIVHSTHWQWEKA